eukprot:CAMPEP_0204298404 /NCGR_PEP_ID=MMETSP0468-20130131/74934_1 /ASSEMBLY_ACC=CAM_ASM_000383 /TAXON_ID=2969 /ORGANISM="Oxyrrhis marina" /LENGTH=68 /DNA_ID=CAMNT_0051277289 /DNA_START=201 /DNA_END=404 /DNA_ORIENTATION=+
MRAMMDKASLFIACPTSGRGPRAPHKNDTTTAQQDQVAEDSANPARGIATKENIVENTRNPPASAPHQ